MTDLNEYEHNLLHDTKQDVSVQRSFVRLKQATTYYKGPLTTKHQLQQATSTTKHQLNTITTSDHLQQATSTTKHQLQ